MPIYDLVYDPRTLTVHSSLPNIPDPGTLSAEGLAGPAWSRLDALNVHAQILATVVATRRSTTEIERTCKTGRGWWVVWMRLPPSHAQDAVRLNEREGSTKPSQTDTEQMEFDAWDLREAFLVRRAREEVVGKTSGAAGRMGSAMWKGLGGGGVSTTEKMGGVGAGWGPRGLAEGIGIDARRYVEGLLSLNR
jgi:hypothetical protein